MSTIPPCSSQACDHSNRIVSQSEIAVHHASRTQAESELPSSSLALDEEALRRADPDGMITPALERYPYMMTPYQVAEFVGMTPQGVRKLLSSGRLIGCHVGSAWRVPKLCLVQYLNGKRREERA